MSDEPIPHMDPWPFDAGDESLPEWDDRKTLAEIFQSAALFPVTGLSDAFYTAVLRCAMWGYLQRKQEQATSRDTQAMQAAIRLARADAYRQGVKDGRTATVEELSQIVDDYERVQELRRRRKERHGEA